jgi:2-dehydro-3-deoxyphosphogalactonate aldolase
MAREIIAILRGVQAHEAVGIGEVLMEVPLNSPLPLKSIESLAKALGKDAEIGAGTVLSVTQVDQVADAGGVLVVSPNMVRDVIKATKNCGLASYPGVLTVTECFNALEHGADGLKFFPSMLIGPTGLAAISAVLPVGTRTFAVGGVGPVNFSDWIAAGVTGFGIGTNLYKPGNSAAEVRENALACVRAYDDAVATRG